MRFLWTLFSTSRLFINIEVFTCCEGDDGLLRRNLGDNEKHDGMQINQYYPLTHATGKIETYTFSTAPPIVSPSELQSCVSGALHSSIHVSVSLFSQ